jgi:WD40 repeat protein
MWFPSFSRKARHAKVARQEIRNRQKTLKRRMLLESLDKRELMAADVDFFASVSSSSAHAYNFVELDTAQVSEQRVGRSGYSTGLDTHPVSGLLYGGSSTLQEVNPATNEVRSVGRFHTDTASSLSMRSLSFSPDGTLYGTASDKLYTIDLTSAKATLVGAVNKAVLHVYKTESGEEILNRTAENYVDGRAPFAFSHDGSRFATPLKDPFIQVCDSQSGEEITRVAIPQRDGEQRVGEDFALDASARRLAIQPTTRARPSAGDLRQPIVEPYGITIYDLETSSQVTTPPVFGQYLEFSHDGQKIVAVDRNEPRNIEPLVTAFDTATGQALMSLAKPDFRNRPGQFEEPGYHSLSPTGEWFAVTLPTRSDLATIQLWNTITGKPGPKFQGATQALVALGFTSDGRQVRAVYEDGKILFWRVPAQAVAIQATVPTVGPFGLSGPTGEQPFGERPAITVSPDGRWTAENLRAFPTSATQSRTSPNYGESTLVKDNHGTLADRTFRFESALGSGPPRFSANGAYLAWIGVDESAEQNQACELKVWEVSSGREVVAKRLPALESTSPQSRFSSRLLSPGAFSADSRRFAIAVPDDPKLNANPEQSIHVWDLMDGRQLHPRVGIDAMRIPSLLSGVSFTQNGELLFASSPVFALASRGTPVASRGHP